MEEVCKITIARSFPKCKISGDLISNRDCLNSSRVLLSTLYFTFPNVISKMKDVYPDTSNFGKEIEV